MKWQPWPQRPDAYAISEDGRIKSLKRQYRVGRSMKTIPEKVLSLKPNGSIGIRLQNGQQKVIHPAEEAKRLSW